MNSFSTQDTLRSHGRSYRYHRLPAIPGQQAARLPYSLKILLENLLRYEDGVSVTKTDIEALLAWDPQAAPATEIAYRPARVLMQDFTGVPAVVDLAAMRDAMVRLGDDPAAINPLQPADLVIDHSVQVDNFATQNALSLNGILEFQRNRERYQFLKWGQAAFRNFRVVPPETGIVHQVNLEYLAQVAFRYERDGEAWICPDTLVGTDSHTTMVNGLGVLGWGVGGIEAEAGMLGQPVSMLIPQVVGFELTGRLAEGSTATGPRADRGGDAACPRRGRQVRGVLRRRPRRVAPGRPGDHRQHGTGVRSDLRPVPDRLRNPGLLASDRPPGPSRSPWWRDYARAQGFFRSAGGRPGRILGGPNAGHWPR